MSNSSPSADQRRATKSQCVVADRLAKLRLIRHLSDEMGLNLAGVEFALATVENLLTLQKRLAVRLNDPVAEQAVEEELGMLLQSLNIPIEL